MLGWNNRTLILARCFFINLILLQKRAMIQAKKAKFSCFFLKFLRSFKVEGTLYLKKITLVHLKLHSHGKINFLVLSCVGSNRNGFPCATKIDSFDFYCSVNNPAKIDFHSFFSKRYTFIADKCLYTKRFSLSHGYSILKVQAT